MSPVNRIGGRTITNLRFADNIDGLTGEEEELAKPVECLDKASTKKPPEDKADRGRGGKTTSEWTGLEFGRSQRAVENREKWRKMAAKSSVVPQRRSRLRDR